MASFRMVLQSADGVVLTATPHKNLGRSYNDGVSTTSSMGNNPQKDFAETVPALSTLTHSAAFVRLLAEVLQPNDGDNVHFARQLADQVLNADLAAKRPALSMGPEDIPLQERITRSLGCYLAEALTPTEQVTFFLSCHLADQVIPEGGLVKESVLFRALSENSPLAEIGARAVLGVRNEIVPLDSELSKSEAFIRVLAQIVGLSDGDTERLTYHFQDTVATSDQGGKNAVLLRSLTEIFSLAEGANDIHIGRPLQENPELSEEILRAAVKLLADDQLPTSDSIAKVLTLVRAWDEVMPTADRLRIGGVWDDTATKIMVLLLKAVLNTQIKKVETP